MERRLKVKNNETGDIVEFKWFDKADPTEADMAEIFKEHQMQQLTRGAEQQVQQMAPGAEHGTITAAPRPLLETVGRDFLKGLPLAGMAAGGTFGGVPGAGLLGAAGKNIQRIGERALGWEAPKPLAEEYVDIGLSGVEAMGAEMGGQVIGKGLGLGLGKVMKPAGEKIGQLFKEGFPVTKGAAVEKLAQKIPPGSWWFKRWGRKLNEMVKASNEQFKGDRLKLVPKGTPYPETAEIDAAVGNWIAGSGGEGAQIAGGNLSGWFKTFGKQMGEIRAANEPLANTLDKMSRSIKKTGNVSIGDINDVFMGAWRTYGKKKYQHLQRAFGQLKEMVMSDLGVAEQATGIPTHSGRVAVEELYRFGHSITRSRYIEGLFNRSTRYVEETGEYVFEPVKFKETVLNSYGAVVKKFGKKSDVPELLMQYADKMEVAGRDLAGYIKTSRTGTVEEALKLGLYGPAAYAGGVPGVVVPAGFNAVMAHSLAHPRGYLKRFLFRETPGAFLTRAGKEVTRAGIMLWPEKEKETIRGPIKQPIKQRRTMPKE